MIDDEERRLAALDLGRQIIALAAAHKIPDVNTNEIAQDGWSMGERLGHVVGLALFVAADAEGVNSIGILGGMGRAIGETTKEETDLVREVLVEEIERGIAQGAGVPWIERPPTR